MCISLRNKVRACSLLQSRSCLQKLSFRPTIYCLKSTADARRERMRRLRVYVLLSWFVFFLSAVTERFVRAQCMNVLILPVVVSHPCVLSPLWWKQSNRRHSGRTRVLVRSSGRGKVLLNSTKPTDCEPLRAEGGHRKTRKVFVCMLPSVFVHAFTLIHTNVIPSASREINHYVMSPNLRFLCSNEGSFRLRMDFDIFSCFYCSPFCIEDAFGVVHCCFRIKQLWGGKI